MRDFSSVTDYRNKGFIKEIGKCIYCGAQDVPLSDEHVPTAEI
jgi:hypothetical protein